MTTDTDESLLGITLETFLLEGMMAARARGRLTSLLNQITLAAKIITGRVRRAGLARALGYTGEINVQGEAVQKLDVFANDTLVASLRRRGHCRGIASEELDQPVTFEEATGDYLVLTDPLDGSSNIDVDISIGTIFGVLRCEPGPGRVPDEAFLQPATELEAAGYVIYGSSTILVLTTGASVHGFTWDPISGEFFLSHENIRCPADGNTYSINEGNAPAWPEAVRHWNAALKAEPSSTLRYVGSLVADAHRTLLRGGIFAYPADTKNPGGKLRLLYEAAPLAKIFEAAGGRASTGRGPISSIQPDSLHQRVPLVLGSRQRVEAYERAMQAR